MPKIETFNTIPVPLPEKRILSRLGYNRHLTRLSPHQQTLLEAAIRGGFSLCRPQGAWTRVPIDARTEETVMLETGEVFASRSLATLLQRSHAVLLMAATAGAQIVDAIGHEVDEAKGMRALVFDAVASETADAALGWINAYVARQLPRTGETLTAQRYSPGYGDLGLENQQILYERLRLDRLGLELSLRYQLIPEKSVCGICGIGVAGEPA